MSNSVLGWVWQIGSVVFLVLLFYFKYTQLFLWFVHTFSWNGTIGLAEIFDFLSAAALVATLIWIYRQAKATERMARFQMAPAVDVNMIYEEGRTCFWFYNASEIPALVSLSVTTPTDNSPGPFRLPPRTSGRRTAVTYDFFNGRPPADGVEVTLNVSVRPAIDDSPFEFKFHKNYRFHNDEWEETTWGIPDMPFITF